MNGPYKSKMTGFLVGAVREPPLAFDIRNSIGILFIVCPIARIVADILINPIQIILVSNHMLIIIALPDNSTGSTSYIIEFPG